MWNLKRNYTNELIQKTDSQNQRTNIQLPGDKNRGKIQGVWDQHVYIPIPKMDNQQGLTVEHRELCSMLCAAWMGGEFGGE